MRRTQPPVRLRRGNPDCRPPGRSQPDEDGRHLPDPLPRRPHLRPAGAAADAGLSGPHPPAGAVRAGGTRRSLGGTAGADGASAVSGLPRGAGRPGGALRKIRRLAPGREAHAGANPPSGHQSGLSARSAPGRAVLTRTGAGVGRTGKAVEDAPARREHHAGRWPCHPAGSRPRPGPAGAELCLLGRHRPLSGAGKGRSGC